MTAFDVVAFLFAIIGSGVYIHGMLKQGKKPMTISWLVWTLLNVVTWASLYEKNRVNGLIIGSTINTSMVFLFSLFTGEKKWEHKYWITISGAMAGAGFILIGSPLVALIASQVVVLIGCWDTFKQC